MIWKNPKKMKEKDMELSLVSEKYYFEYMDPEISDVIKSCF